MSKPTALTFAQQGDKYLDTPYSQMDCQKFYEQMLADVGVKKDLKGSNAWYRAMDWTGTPEECMKTFGQIPIGATLFIWANDGGEVARGYTDGKGNATHIGVFIGRNTGAIHSSATRGKVAFSNFKCKTIRGGWNRVGLTRLLSYGEKVDKMIGTPTDIPVVTATPAVTNTPVQTATPLRTAMVTGGRLNVRTGPGRENPAITQLDNGEQVEIIADHGEWAEINYKRHGYVMKQFLTEV